MTDKPSLENYYLARPESSGKKYYRYAYSLDQITAKILDDLDTHDIPLLHDHGLLVWHEDVTDRIPTADDVYPMGAGDELTDFLRSCWDFTWTGSQIPKSPDNPLAMKTKPVKAGEVKARLKRELPCVGAIELTPHHRPRSDAHYIRGHQTYDIKRADGTALDGLVDLLNANSCKDRQLMKAMILSAFWGGPYGATPMMVLRAPHGPGSGKSETIKILDALLGGGTWVTPQPKKTYADAIQRALGTPSEAIKRLVVLDNVETGKVNLRDPALASYITGHTLPLDRLYEGAYQPPNNKIWCMTLNSQKFSKDLASRSVIIDVGPPPQIRSKSDQWADPIAQFGDVWRQYITDHREAIICDCIKILRGADKCDLSGVAGGRWSQWAHGVLSKIDGGDDLWRLVMDRQTSMDQQSAEASDIVDKIRGFLCRHGVHPDQINVCIPTKILKSELADHFGHHPDGYSAQRFWSDLAPYPKTGPFRRYGLEASSGRDTKHNGGRGLVWRPDPTTPTVLDWDTATTDQPIMVRGGVTDPPPIDTDQKDDSPSDSVRSSDSDQKLTHKVDQTDGCDGDTPDHIADQTTDDGEMTWPDPTCPDCGTEYVDFHDMLDCNCGILVD